jgi:branched-chain amino acid transport system substrate-binding protein
MQSYKLFFLFFRISLFLGAACVSTSASAQIRIGVNAPLEGPSALFGHQISDGARFAVETINERGGVAGQKLELRLMDDGGLPDRATSNARQLITADKVIALIGYPLSPEALAARNIASAENVLMVALATAPELTQENRAPILRTIGRADKLATMVVDFVAANFENKAVGVQFAQQQIGFDTSLRRALEARKIEPKRSETAPIQAFQQAPTWAREVQALILPLGATPSWAAQVTKENEALSLVMAQTVLRDDPSKALEGLGNATIISNPWPDFFASARDTIARAKAKNLNTNGYFVYAYSAVQVVAASIMRANGQTSGSTLVAAVQRGEGIETAIGVLRFDRHGDIIGWRYAVLSASAGGPDVCKTPQCKKYEVCPSDCPK